MIFINKIFLTFLLLLFISVRVTFAVDSINVRTMKEIREELRTRIPKAEASKEAIRERAKERDELRKEQITGIKGKLDEMRRRNITKFFNNMMEKLAKVLLRLDKVAGKIETRLTKMKANGKDTANLETKVIAMKAEIEKVKTEIATTKSSLETILSSGTPKEEFAKVKEATNAIWTQIKNIHQSLVGIITEMKGMSEKDKVNPTKSVTIEPTEALEE